MVHYISHHSLMERILLEEINKLDLKAKQMPLEKKAVFQTLTLEQKIRFINLNDHEHLLIFLITLPLSVAYKTFFEMSHKHQQAFLTFGKINTSLEFMRLNPHERDLFIELPDEIRHKAVRTLNQALYDRHQKNSFEQSIYTAVMTPEQIIYNFKMYGNKASTYETKYIQHNDSSQRFEIKNCDSCGYTIHHCFSSKPMHCMNCDLCCTKI